MKKIFLLSALSLASLFSLSCLATTVSLNQYDRIYHEPVAWNRTVTESKNMHAFTVLLDNGQLLSWGQSVWPDALTHAPVVPEGRSVKEIFSSEDAFTALLDNNTMLCWSTKLSWSTSGADIRTPFISPERKICSINSNSGGSLDSNSGGFVALLDNGAVVGWGNLNLPPSLSDLEDQGQKVISVTSSSWAFAAVVVNTDTAQQTIISWGDPGVKSSVDPYNATIEIPAGIKVTSIAANDYAFAALLDNGTIKAWGDKNYGGVAPLFLSDKKIVSLAAAAIAFTAIFEDGTIQSWGYQQSGGKTPLLPAGSTVTKIFASGFDFAALLSGGDHDGDILCWGYYSRSYYSKSECQMIKVGMLIKSVVANQFAFAAIRNDGSVIAWGYADGGGDASSLPPGKRVQSITPAGGAGMFITPAGGIGVAAGGFTALFEDGTIHSWGHMIHSWGPDEGWEPTDMPADRKVVAITSIFDIYMALLDNGSLFSWGGGQGAGSDGLLIKLPQGTKALWMASPFEKYVLKPTSSQ